MRKKSKYFFLVFVSAVCFAVLLFAVNFIFSKPYRDQIPSHPDPNTLSKPIQEQIHTAEGKAYLFTTANTLGTLGMVYQSCTNNEKAAQCYRLAAKKNSNQWRWNYYLGYLNLQEGALQEAIENFKPVIEKVPTNSFAVYYTGEAYQKLGSDDTAKKIFHTIIDAPDQNDKETTRREDYFPLKTYAMFQLARIYSNANSLDSAEMLLTKIIQDQMAFGPAYRLLGSVYSAKGKTALAARYATRANDLADYAPPADNLADDIAIISRSDEYLLKQIDDAVHSQNYRWALALCNQGLKYFPDNKRLISNAIYENFRQGYDNKALFYLDKHFNYYSNDAKELMDFTDLLYNRKHLPEALKYFHQVKKLLPNNSSLAMWLYDRGKKEEAIAMMNELVKHNPGDVKILADVIRLVLDNGDTELADDYFTTLTKLSPAGPETLKTKGLMAEKQGDIKRALAVYDSAYQSDPKDLIFTRELIDLHIREKNWAVAIGYLRSALDIYPNEPLLLEKLGKLLIACPDATLRNVPEGVEYSERAFINARSSYTTRLSAGKTLATAYVSLGDKKNAAKLINKTIELAKEGHESEEYISYFKALVSR